MKSCKIRAQTTAALAALFFFGRGQARGNPDAKIFKDLRAIFLYPVGRSYPSIIKSRLEGQIHEWTRQGVSKLNLIISTVLVPND